MNENLTIDDGIAVIESAIIRMVGGSEQNLDNLPIVIVNTSDDGVETSYGPMSTTDNNVANRIIAMCCADKIDQEDSVIQIEVTIEEGGLVQVIDAGCFSKGGNVIIPPKVTPTGVGFCLMTMPLDLLLFSLVSDGVLDIRIDEPSDNLVDFVNDPTAGDSAQGYVMQQSQELIPQMLGAESLAASVLALINKAIQISEAQDEIKKKVKITSRHIEIIKRHAQRMNNIRQTLRNKFSGIKTGA